MGNGALPELVAVKGYEYLYELFSSLSYDKEAFVYKLEFLLRLSAIPKPGFTMEDIMTEMSEYDEDFIVKTVRKLAGTWLEYFEGRYFITRHGERFMQVIPVLNSENQEYDEASMNFYLSTMDMMVKAKSPVEALASHRNRAIQHLQRDKYELENAIKSKNLSKIKEVSDLAGRHLQDIQILRSHEDKLFEFTKDTKTHRDVYELINEVCTYYSTVMEEYAKMLEDSFRTRVYTITKQDADEYLLNSPFTVIARLLEEIPHIPFAPPLLDTTQIIGAYDALISREAVQKSNRSIPARELTQRESIDLKKPTLVERFSLKLIQLLANGSCSLEALACEKWPDFLCDFSALFYLESKNKSLRKTFKPIPDFDVTTEGESIPRNTCVLKMSTGTIVRRDNV